MPTVNGLVRQCPYHVVYSGAGMSLAAGIPTFRGTNGLWVLPPEIKYTVFIVIGLFIAFHAWLLWAHFVVWLLFVFVEIGGSVAFVAWAYCQWQGYMPGKNLRAEDLPPLVRFAEWVKRTHGRCIGGGIWGTRWRWLIWMLYGLFLHRHIVNAEPTSGHRFFARLSKKEGKEVYVVTQNVDELERKAGMHPERVVQLHGSAGTLLCLHCVGNCAICPDTFSRRTCTHVSDLAYTNIMDESTGQVKRLGLPWGCWTCANCGAGDGLRTGCLLFGDFARRASSNERRKSGWVPGLFHGQTPTGQEFQPHECVFWLIGTSNKVNSSWSFLTDIRGATVIEVNPDEQPKFAELSEYHRYVHLCMKQEDVFDMLARRDVVPLEGMGALPFKTPVFSLAPRPKFDYNKWKAEQDREDQPCPPPADMLREHGFQVSETDAARATIPKKQD